MGNTHTCGGRVLSPSSFSLQKKPYLQNYPAEHLEERRSLRKRLQCRSFDWYLKTVYPKAIEELKKDKAVQHLLPQLGL